MHADKYEIIRITFQSMLQLWESINIKKRMSNLFQYIDKQLFQFIYHLNVLDNQYPMVHSSHLTTLPLKLSRYGDEHASSVTPDPSPLCHQQQMQDHN